MKKILQHHYGEATKSAQLLNNPAEINHVSSSVNNTSTTTSNGTNYTAAEPQPAEEETMQRWIDQYNSPRDSIRMTTERFPKSVQIGKDLTIPLGAVIQPYYNNFKDSIPTANFGTNQIVRCSSCRAYVSPFCMFHEGGSRWTCNLCGKVEATPSFYFSKLNENGERLDKFNRPELYSGSFDIKAGSDYMSRPPAPPVYFFLLDVSQEAIKSGMLEMTIHVIKDTISKDLLLGGPRTMVGIVSYDSNVHFYNMKQKLKQPHMMVMTDLDDMFLPIPDELLINLSESKDMLLNLLDSFNNMFVNTQDNGSCLSKAINACVRVFKHLGGKLIITQASDNFLATPQQKDGKIPENKSLNILPSSPHYCNLCADLHHAFISVSLFVFSKTFKDLVTLGELARYLNGDISYYPDKPMRKQSYFYDFKNALIKDYTWESVFRIRISRGWQISRIYGNFIIKSTDLLSVSNIDENKGLVYEFYLMDDAKANDMFCVQTALLYTTSNGERRIRCHNYSILLSGSMQSIYDHIDSSAVTLHLLRQGLEQIYKTADVSQAKSFMINKCKDIIRQSSVLKQSKPGNMVTHETLQALPLNILGILKNKIFNGKYDRTIDTDERNVFRITMNCLPVEESLTYFVPYLFPLLEMRDGDIGAYDETGNFNFPSMIPLSFSSLQSNGIYLMDEGSQLIIFVGKTVDQTTLNNIFGVSAIHDVKEFNEDMLYHNSKDIINERIYNIITELRSRKSNKYCPLAIIREGDAGETDQRFFYKLIQDKMEGYPDGYNVSYNDFYQMLSH